MSRARPNAAAAASPPTIDVCSADRNIGAPVKRALSAPKSASALSVTTDEILEIPYAWFGSVEQICDKLEAARERWGVSYFVLQGGMDDMAPVVSRLTGT
jgi:hypothetical protein